MVTSKEHSAVFPEASVNVYDTVVVPKLKKSPGEIADSTVIDRESPSAVGGIHETRSPVPCSIVLTIFDGHPLMVSGSESTERWK